MSPLATSRLGRGVYDAGQALDANCGFGWYPARKVGGLDLALVTPLRLRLRTLVVAALGSLCRDSRLSPKPGWTVETALHHIEELLEEMDKRYEQRWEAQQAAVETARITARDAQARVLAIVAVIAAIFGSLVYFWNPLHR